MQDLVKGINSNIKTVVVHIIYTPTILTQSAPIFLDFVPDVITIKQVNVTIATTTTTFGVYKLKCQFIQDDLVAFPINLNYDGAGNRVYSTFSQQCDISFLNKSKNIINGNYSFQVVAADGFAAPNIDINVSLTLQFIKY